MAKSKSKKSSIANDKTNSDSEWLSKIYSSQTERQAAFSSLSFRDIPPLVSDEKLSGWDPSMKLGYPGLYPFTRGVQPTMYRGRLWTMRQFAGFGSPEDTNSRFKYLLEQGITGLSTAFDMPTLMGYDADHKMSVGEVGREGVNISSIEDMERLFDDISLADVSVSMTINCTAPIILGMYFAVARRRGVDLQELAGTLQNDILKEYIAQREWISPPEPSVKLVCDVIEFCANFAKKFNPVSISGYHIREAGSTAVQELAFTIYNGITYVEECLKRGMEIDDFAPRLSFFFDVHSDFFEEIAKLRAARRIWAKLVKERFGSNDLRSMKLRMHTQTAGVSLTAQQPMNNVTRVALQALAGVLGGTQSLHTNSMDETLSLPTEEAVTVALRTQQVIAEETGVADVIDPLGGSYYLEWLTDEIEKSAFDYIKKLDEMGGMFVAIDNGFVQREISDAAYMYQKQVESGERKIVGVNCYSDSNSKQEIPTLKIHPEIESEQISRLKAFKLKRNQKKLDVEIGKLKKACCSGVSTMEFIISSVDSGATVGEISDIFREIFGCYSDPGFI